MNARERFLETIVHFNSRVVPPKWEFGYWGSLIDDWYKQGLEKRHYPHVPQKISNPSASIANAAWSSLSGDRLPMGIAVTGGGLYHPGNDFAMDRDVMVALNMDKGQIVVNINLLFHPMFDIEILEEDDERLVYVDLEGVKKLFLKESENYPSPLAYPITDWKSWERLKDERLSTKGIAGRFPKHWDALLENYKNRDYPLVLGGFPAGYFGTLATLMGYENLFLNYFDEPELIHDIQNTFTELWIALYSEVLSQVDVDLYVYWEDISAGTGSMVSPAMMREFMLPYYRRMSDFLRHSGVDALFVDTDGDCFDIIPIFLEGGATGMYPIEASCGMDVVEVRHTFPKLQMMGGIPKYEIIHGKERIDQILQPIQEVLKVGGYIPFGDHLISPGVHWKDFTYYRLKLNNILEESRTY
jgi:uroporphyrinogen decarboxylase